MVAFLLFDEWRNLEDKKKKKKTIHVKDIVTCHLAREYSNDLILNVHARALKLHCNEDRKGRANISLKVRTF